MHLAAAVLALSIIWQPVTTDCRGGQESGVRYHLSYLWRECTGPETEPPSCARFHVEQTLEDTRWDTAIGEADPPPGAGWWFEVVAEDGAGNRSDDPCL